jgi:predicted lipid-binding transport protein (Tim44 family)
VSSAPASDPAIGLGQIQAADPAFDLEAFKRQAVETFVAVKGAIQARELDGVAESLSSGVYDDLSQDVMSLVTRSAIQHYDGLSPTSVTVVAANRDPQGDAITLRIQAVATQYIGSEDSGFDPGPGVPGPFTEFWTFSRNPDATSAAMARKECPTCGAPIDVDTGRICRFCNSLLPPPYARAGWVVAAIRPAQENPG